MLTLNLNDMNDMYMYMNIYDMIYCLDYFGD